MDDLRDLERIALMRYASLIQSSYLVENKLRFILYDGSILDIFHSFEKPLHWAFHWDRRQLDGRIYRHDNIPHKIWKKQSPFGWHFHEKSEENVVISDFTSDPISNLTKMFQFIENYENYLG